MHGKVTLYRDQYGNTWFARTVRELHRQLGGKRPAKMYVDTKDGRTLHVGYVVGRHWCTAYQRVEQEA